MFGGPTHLYDLDLDFLTYIDYYIWKINYQRTILKNLPSKARYENYGSDDSYTIIWYIEYDGAVL